MKIFIALIMAAMLLTSCARQPVNKGVSFSSASTGLLKNNLAPFPIYLTDKMESREALEKKYSDDLFLVHTGHVLKPNLDKAANEKNLSSLSEQGFNLVNLTLEDFVIADSQGINFEQFVDVPFINSSVIDLNIDNLATARNISSNVVVDGIAFIGLSDAKIDKKLTKEKYIINDYVLAILKVKKAALNENDPETLRSFIIIHNLGNKINDVMIRLPPSFINSLAD
ncbi:MAG: hypothetical protein WC635_05860 [Bacteriovorax sp.]|jgi:hypothetical protein